VLLPDGAPQQSLTVADGATLMQLYSAGFAVLFVILALQTAYAYTRRAALGLDAVERYITRATMRAHVSTAAVGLTAAVIASLSPTIARWAGLVFFSLGPLHGLLGWRRGVNVERLARANARDH
jgi:hypothetical protein